MSEAHHVILKVLMVERLLAFSVKRKIVTELKQLCILFGNYQMTLFLTLEDSFLHVTYRGSRLDPNILEIQGSL